MTDLRTIISYDRREHAKTILRGTERVQKHRSSSSDQHC